MAFSPEQQQVAQAFTRAPSYSKAGQLSRQALLEAGIVESGLRRNPSENDLDSKGVLQQRASQGWGTVAQELNPTTAAEMFLQHAIRLEHQYHDPGALAQAVQRSAFPERYGEHAGEAQQLLRLLGGGGVGGAAPGGAGGQPQQSRPAGASGAQVADLLGLIEQLQPSGSSTSVQGLAVPKPAEAGGSPVPRELPQAQKLAPSSLLDVISKIGQDAEPVAASASGAQPAEPALASSPGALPKGLTDFGGKQVAAWIAPALEYARAHGWRGGVTSGYRSKAEQERIYNSGVRPAAVPGTSNHEGTEFPRGAVDVSEAQRLAQILQRSPYAGKLVYAGAKDPVHFSHPHAGGY